METTADQSLMSTGEVAQLFKVDPKTVMRWAKSGKLSWFWTPGGHRRYWRAEVEQLMTRG